jgi:hypothetical protein
MNMKIRLVLLSAMLMLVAFATMAPHWQSWDTHPRVATIDIEMVALSLTPNGEGFHGDAEITLKFDRSSAGPTYETTAQITAKCVAPLCGGWSVRGQTKFGSETDESVTKGQGTFSGVFQPVYAADGITVIRLHGDDIPMRVRIGTFLKKTR